MPPLSDILLFFPGFAPLSLFGFVPPFFPLFCGRQTVSYHSTFFLVSSHHLSSSYSCLFFFGADSPPSLWGFPALLNWSSNALVFPDFFKDHPFCWLSCFFCGVCVHFECRFSFPVQSVGWRFLPPSVAPLSQNIPPLVFVVLFTRL